MKLTNKQIIAIGALVAFGLPICTGLAVGYFFGFWLGVASAGIVMVSIALLTHRYIRKIGAEPKSGTKYNEREKKI